MVVTLILAGGESRRMNRPKALLPIGNETFAKCIARKSREAGIHLVVLVAGAHFEEIEAESSPDDWVLIKNLRYNEGQFSSLQEGLRNVPARTTEVLVWPVDQPLVETATIEVLLSKYSQTKAPVVIPTYQSKRGHPVLYNLNTIQKIITLDSSHTAKDLQAIYRDQIAYVEVDDYAILIDIDTPEDYKKHIV